jgi:hypothetical protein
MEHKMNQTKEQVVAAGLKAFAIINKLGGTKFLAITGASRLEALDNGVLFAIPSNLAKHGINRIKVRLNDQSTYDVRFIKVDKEKYTHVDVEAIENVSAELLRGTFSEVTGLLLSL